MTTTRRLLNVLDAKDAALRLLMERRSKGRFELHLAISDLYDGLQSGWRS